LSLAHTAAWFRWVYTGDLWKCAYRTGAIQLSFSAIMTWAWHIYQRNSHAIQKASGGSRLVSDLDFMFSQNANLAFIFLNSLTHVYSLYQAYQHPQHILQAIEKVLSSPYLWVYDAAIKLVEFSANIIEAWLKKKFLNSFISFLIKEEIGEDSFIWSLIKYVTSVLTNKYFTKFLISTSAELVGSFVLNKVFSSSGINLTGSKRALDSPFSMAILWSNVKLAKIKLYFLILSKKNMRSAVPGQIAIIYFHTVLIIAVPQRLPVKKPRNGSQTTPLYPGTCVMDVLEAG